MDIEKSNPAEEGIVEVVSSALRSMGPSERIALIDDLTKLLESERLGVAEAVSTDYCPLCGSDAFDKHGFTRTGRQRYRCCRCWHTFSDQPPGNLFRYTKLDDDQWYRFIQCFINGLTLRKSAEICEVCLKTSWFMRFRILELIHRNLPSFEIKNDIRTEVDEFYVAESFKGNMKKAGYEMPRKPYRHGQASHPAGNHELICIMTAVNDLGDMFYEIACRGFFTHEAAKAALEKSVARGTIVSTDNHNSYIKVLREIGAVHDHHPANVHGPINRVNGLHAQIREFMGPFHGVSSKYLDLYLGWFKWTLNYGKGRLADTSDSLSVQMLNGEYQHRRSMLKEIVFPFRFPDGSASKYSVC